MLSLKRILVGNMILEVNNVYAGYGDYDVLKDVSLHVDEHDIICLIGPNGAGKSTVFRSIFGFIKPRLGTVLFKDEDITGLLPVEILRKGISYVLQRHSVFPDMTIQENLDMGAYIWKDKSRIQDDLNMIYDIFPILQEKQNELGRNLSGGQQRMLEIGRTLMTRPQFLLLDEPTLGLAPKVVSQIFEKIVEIHEETRMPIMIVEQNARKALEVSDRAYVLELGQIRMEGPATDIANNPEVRDLYLGGKSYSAVKWRHDHPPTKSETN